MRKHLTVSLSACLVTATFVGCGEKTQEAKVSEQLDVLLDQMSRLRYAEAPVKSNELAYTLGKEVDGVKVPGSTRFEAAYLDQALTLIPLAEDIRKDGSELQKQSASAIIGSIRTEEAAFLIDEAEQSFRKGAKALIELRSKLAVLREIQALNNSVAGDGAEMIETYRTGLSVGGTEVSGINAMQQRASQAAELAGVASKDLESYNKQIADLREKVSEYEALELKLASQARSSQSTDKFDKLDQATAAAKEAEKAQAEIQKLEIDAWISERVANLAEFKRELLAGQPEVGGDQLLGKLDGYMQKASTETNIPSGSDIYTNLAQLLSDAKNGAGDDAIKAASFLLAMSDYGTSAAADLDERSRLVAAVDKHVVAGIGDIGVLEMKIAQIKLDRQRVADKLAEIDADRQAVLKELATSYSEIDSLTQAAGFDRMAAAVETLKQAEEAVKGSGKKNDMALMSVYMLHARALHQQSVSARLYMTTLSSIAAAGPELIGGELHTTLSARVQEMQSLLSQAASASSELQTAASIPSANLNTDDETPAGQVASRQLEVFDSLIESISQGVGVGGDTTSPVTNDAPASTPSEPADVDTE